MIIVQHCPARPAKKFDIIIIMELKLQNSKKPTPETLPLVKCAVVKAEPTLTPELFQHFTHGAESIIITSFANGTVPNRLSAVIKLKVDSGIPVFLISNNSGDNHGIERLKYQVQVDIAQAGAIALKKVNINNIESVIRAIQEETVLGKKGSDLERAISERFGVATS